MDRRCRYFSSAALALLIAAPVLEARDPSAGSLWMRGEREQSMFSDKRATRRGDIVTIVVGEDSQITTSMKLSTNKESSVSNDFARLFFNDVLRRGGEAPSTDISIGPNAHSGSGSLNNSQSLSTRLSVQVIDELPNGNLVLEGVRILSYGGETYYMLTQGVCRPEDIDPDNSIHSTLVADARIEVVSEGSLTDAQKQGWLTRAFNHYSP